MIAVVEVTEASVVAFGTIGATTFLGVLGWVLTQAIKLSQLMASVSERLDDIEKRSEDHETRLRSFEARSRSTDRPGL